MTQRIQFNDLTTKIILAMFLGLLIGLVIKFLPVPAKVIQVIVNDILKTGGAIFITTLTMLVVPVVFVSLVCGAASIDIRKIGRVGGKTVAWYLLTTALAITLALFFASIFHIGQGLHLTEQVNFNPQAAPSVKQVILDLFPTNPFQALAQGKMLQIIFFSLLLGIALTHSGEPGERILKIFQDANHTVMSLVLLVMKIAPYGIFCLTAALFAELGFQLIVNLLGYFLTVLLVLGIHLFVSYSVILKLWTRLSPITFFRKMRQAMLFAFSTASSNASIPINLETVEEKLGVKNSIASFIIPLGATVNMDGTAIMQGVATVFIAHIYQIDLGFSGYLTVIGMATLASIGTAGVPSAGLIMLAMVLKQVGLPVEGIAFIIGVDRLLDMSRTAVNITGDAIVAVIVGKSEQELDESVYNAKENC